MYRIDVTKPVDHSDDGIPDPEDAPVISDQNEWMVCPLLVYPNEKTAARSKCIQNPQSAPRQHEIDTIDLSGVPITINHGRSHGSKERHFAIGEILTTVTDNNGDVYGMLALNRANTEAHQKIVSAFAKTMIQSGSLNGISIKTEIYHDKEGRVLKRVYPEVSLLTPDIKPVHETCGIRSWDVLPVDARVKLEGKMAAMYPPNLLDKWKMFKVAGQQAVKQCNSVSAIVSEEQKESEKVEQKEPENVEQKEPEKMETEKMETEKMETEKMETEKMGQKNEKDTSVSKPVEFSVFQDMVMKLFGVNETTDPSSSVPHPGPTSQAPQSEPIAQSKKEETQPQKTEALKDVAVPAVVEKKPEPVSTAMSDPAQPAAPAQPEAGATDQQQQQQPAASNLEERLKALEKENIELRQGGHEVIVNSFMRQAIAQIMKDNPNLSQDEARARAISENQSKLHLLQTADTKNIEADSMTRHMRIASAYGQQNPASTLTVPSTSALGGDPVAPVTTAASAKGSDLNINSELIKLLSEQQNMLRSFMQSAQAAAVAPPAPAPAPVAAPVAPAVPASASAAAEQKPADAPAKNEGGGEVIKQSNSYRAKYEDVSVDGKRRRADYEEDLSTPRMLYVQKQMNSGNPYAQPEQKPVLPRDYYEKLGNSSLLNAARSMIGQQADETCYAYDYRVKHLCALQALKTGQCGSLEVEPPKELVNRVISLNSQTGKTTIWPPLGQSAEKADYDAYLASSAKKPRVF